MSLIDSPDNGATEIPGTSNNSLFVFYAGPIRHWWGTGRWGTRAHKVYTNQRDTIHTELSADFLVYAPYRAWRGPWNELAQKVNEHAVMLCDAMVWLHVDGVLAHGTDEELLLAMDMGKPTFDIGVGDNYTVWDQLADVKQKLHLLAEGLGRTS